MRISSAKRSMFLPTLALWVVLLAAAPGVAAPFVLVSDDRTISAVGSCELTMCSGPDSDSASPSPAFSSFVDSVAAGAGGWADQNSSVSVSGMSGSGQAGGWSDIDWGTGRSTFDVTFSVPSRTIIDLDGSLSAEDLVGFGYSETTLKLYQGASIIYQETADPFSGPVVVDFQSVVAPGTYRLVAVADGDVWMFNDWSLTLTGEAVAVPSLGPVGMAALAVGLLIGGYASSATRRSARSRLPTGR
jgi:hypothetical protein